jgi:hypothetical protein
MRVDPLKPRTCAFCGDRDPMWNFVPSVNWTVVNGLDRCSDCGWMGYTVPLSLNSELGAP